MLFNNKQNFDSTPTLSQNEILEKMARLQNEINQLQLLYQQQQTQNMLDGKQKVHSTEFSMTNQMNYRQKITVDNHHIHCTDKLVSVDGKPNFAAENIIPVADNKIHNVNRSILENKSPSLSIYYFSVVINYSSCGSKPIFEREIFFRSSNHTSWKSNCAMLVWPVANFLWWEEDDYPWERLNQGPWHRFYRPPDESRYIKKMRTEYFRLEFLRLKYF